MTEMNLTLSDMKAQISKTKKKNLTVSKKFKDKEKAAQKEAKKAVKISTAGKAKKEAKPKAEKTPKVPFETYESNIAKLMKISLAEETRNDKKIKVGENKGIRLESLPDRKELVVKVNGKVLLEIYPGKKGYKFCVGTRNFDKIAVPKGAEVKEHPTWKDIIVAEPNEMISQIKA